ncbi:MAG: hypothetical protein PHV59_02885, partial [Victivallales bacterium]|nr:hypothetical protein [Victivallales bacterium]
MKKLLIPGGLLLVFSLYAQHIGYLMPFGGKTGETVEVLLGGQRLWGIKNAVVSGKGVKVKSLTLVPGIPPVGGKQRKFLIEWMRNLAAGKKTVPAKPDDAEELKDLKKHGY